MRVNQTNSQSVQSSEVSQTRKNKGPNSNSDSTSSTNLSTSASAAGANAQISSRAKDMAKAQAAAKGAPDVREEKIAELRRRIEAGQYNVDPDAVAERMVAEHAQTAGV